MQSPEDDEAAGDDQKSWKVTVERAFCLPMMLVANFVIALYFRAVYVSMTKRRRKCDVRTLLLHASAFLSFASLVGFAKQNDRVLRHMNDISEACIVLAFSSQISIITSDASKLCNLRSLRHFKHSAEAFCALAIAVVALSIAAILDDQMQLLQAVVVWHESLTLVFIVSFRFYYITLSRGSLITLLRQQPLETLLQVLLVTHAYPFIIAKHCTGTALDVYQGLYLRILVLGCVYATTRERKNDDSRSRRGKKGKSNRGPVMQHKLSSILPQTSTQTNHTRRASARPSLMTMHSFKRVCRQRHPNLIFPEPISMPGTRSGAVSSAISETTA